MKKFETPPLGGNKSNFLHPKIRIRFKNHPVVSYTKNLEAFLDSYGPS